jgi:hypothetical protein
MPVKPAVTKHVFVIGRQGTAVNMRGPFIDEQAAHEWIRAYRPGAPCWLVPAEYAGLVPHAPLDKDGKPVTREE